MKKVLIISYFYPPYQGIGAQRPYKLAKYFKPEGWEPVVLTVNLPGSVPSDIRTIRTDYHDVLENVKLKLGFRANKGFQDQLGIYNSQINNSCSWKSKSIKFIKQSIAYPDPYKGWFRFAIKAASDFLDKEQVDIIISTSYPYTAHLVARQLKRKYKIPWIADLRDLWSQNHFDNKAGLIRFFERQLEIKTLSDSNALVTVTKRFAEDLKSLHKNKKVMCITNGFDANEFPDKPVKLNDKFTITYTGTLYDGKRNPSLLFEAIKQLIDENKINKDLIEVRFYCRKANWFIETINKHHLNDIVTLCGYVSRGEVLERQRESQLLLLLLDKNNAEKDVYPAKVFEYFGAGRPIIAIGGQGGIVKELLEETNAGKFAIDVYNLRNFLVEYYSEFIKSGEVKSHINSNVMNFTYNSIAKKYAKVLNEIISK